MNTEESGRRIGTTNTDEKRPGDRYQSMQSKFERREERGERNKCKSKIGVEKRNNMKGDNQREDWYR